MEKFETEKIKAEIDNYGVIVKLFDKKSNVNFVKEKNVFNRGGLQIWVKEGKRGRDPGRKLSHKFDPITFEKGEVFKKNSKIIFRKRKNGETLTIAYKSIEEGIEIESEIKSINSKLLQFEFFFSWDIPAGTNILVPRKNKYFTYLITPFGRIITKNLKFEKGPVYILKENGNGIKIEFSDLFDYVIYHRGNMRIIGGYTDAKIIKKGKSLKEKIKISFVEGKKVYKPVVKEKFEFPEILKNPYFKNRWIHLSLYYKKVELKELFFLFRNFKKLGYNGIVLGIGKGMKYESYPQISEKWSYSKNEIREIRDYLRNLGMEIIPEFPTLGHQNDTNLVKVDKSLVEDPENPTVYCTSNPKTYGVIFSLLEEIIDIFKPEYFHLTHDEVQHWFSKRRMGICERCKGKKLWEIYSEDVNKLHSFLKSKNIRMCLWGDMLLDHRKFKICNCNGAVGNVYKAIDLIPKDILIFDWHYHTFSSYPSLNYFRKKGFDVFLGVSFFKPEAIAAFTRYAKKIGINEGAIETTWAVPVVEELPLESIFIASQLFQNPDCDLRNLKKKAYEFAVYLYTEVRR